MLKNSLRHHVSVAVAIRLILGVIPSAMDCADRPYNLLSCTTILCPYYVPDPVRLHTALANRHGQRCKSQLFVQLVSNHPADAAGITDQRHRDIQPPSVHSCGRCVESHSHTRWSRVFTKHCGSLRYLALRSRVRVHAAGSTSSASGSAYRHELGKLCPGFLPFYRDDSVERPIPRDLSTGRCPGLRS